MAGRCRRRLKSWTHSDLMMPLRQTAIEGASTLAVSLTRYTLPLRYLGASALSSVATIFCRYAWPLGMSYWYVCSILIINPSIQLQTTWNHLHCKANSISSVSTNFELQKRSLRPSSVFIFHSLDSKSLQWSSNSSMVLSNTWYVQMQWYAT